jgi:S1-C subfamily serine protease
LPGDIVLALDGHTIEEPGDLAWGLSEAPDGAPIAISIVRGGASREVLVESDAATVVAA